MNITSQDILFITLAFCALWFTAAMFWLLWQIATILRNVNETIADARDKMHKMEIAISGIRSKFDHASSLIGLGANAVAKLVEYAVDKKEEMMEERKSSGKKKGKNIL